jgi:FOG: LysM repeat
MGAVLSKNRPSSPLNTRLLQGLPIRLAALLVGGGLLLSACTSEAPPGAAADSTGTSTTAVSEPTAEPAGTSDEDGTSDDRTLSEKLADASVETRVKQVLIREPRLRVFPFRPTVVDGHLILRGDVNTPEQYRRAERIAGRVEGVTTLTNRVTMKGRPVTEKRLAETDSTDTAEEDAAVYHTVREGDTLWKIAREYRSSVEQIRNLNGLRSNELSPGQRIRVR